MGSEGFSLARFQWGGVGRTDCHSECDHIVISRHRMLHGSLLLHINIHRPQMEWNNYHEVSDRTLL